LFNTFTSPFADSRTGTLDQASMRSYKQPKMQPVDEKVKDFEDSTLFFMFYGVPQDHMQAVASEALFSRGWRYHKKDQHWYRQIVPNSEFLYFEPTTWKTVQKSNFTFQTHDFETAPLSKSSLQ